MRELFAFLIRVAQFAFFSAIVLALLLPVIQAVWPFLVLGLIIAVYRSLNAYAGRVEEASAARRK